MSSGCCGHPSRRRRQPELTQRLPPNPAVPGGVRLLFLGAGHEALRGPESNSRYHVSSGHRYFTVHAKDVPGLLRRRDVILAP
jgi:hypothetical protein